MCKTLTHSFYFSIFLLAVKLIDANRWNGSGGNRLNAYKPTSGGGFNSWRQQTFKHTTINNHRNNFNHEDTNNFNQNSHKSGNNHWYPEHSSRPNSEPPTVNFSQSESDTKCALPTMGDASKFEIRCIFINSEQDEDCSSAGSNFLASGTSVVLKCRPPFKNEQGDLRIWVCEKGIWKGEFKALMCIHSSSPTGITNNHFGGNIYNQSSQSQPVNNYHFKKPLNSWDEQKENIAKKPLIPGLIPGLIEDGDDASAPPWFAALNKKRPTTTTTSTTVRTTTTTTTTTTTRPTTTTTRPTTTTTRPTTTSTATTTTTPGWNSDLNKNNEENTLKCPSLSKRTGVQLKCVSKSPVPGDPSSHVVSQSDCNAPQVVGTEAFYNCEQYYEASLGFAIQYRKCKDDGTWTGSGGDNQFTCALECGKPNPVGRIPLITNGEPTYRAQWPWHAALFYKNNRKIQYDYNCGGTLINRRVVLTAAHCVTEYYTKLLRNINRFRIDLGRYQRTVEDEYVQTYAAEAIIPHPSYNPVSFDSDIAIIILKERVTIGFHVRPICYPQLQNSAFDELDGSYGSVVGFGKDENSELADILQMARLKVVSQSECAESFADTNHGATLTKSTTFCAGLKNATNSCSGDSGGGMYFPVNNGAAQRWYLQGLVSVGISTQDGSNRCDPTRFSVYTRISPYADWIVRVLSEQDALL